jgi:hypothetical protein
MLTIQMQTRSGSSTKEWDRLRTIRSIELIASIAPTSKSKGFSITTDGKSVTWTDGKSFTCTATGSEDEMACFIRIALAFAEMKRNAHHATEILTLPHTMDETDSWGLFDIPVEFRDEL